MTRIILGTCVVLVLLVGGLLVAPSFINWDQYKEQGQSQIKAMTGYDVKIGGSFQIAFLPFPHVKASDVTIVNPSVSPDPLAQFEDLSVGVALAPLLKKQVQVSDITLVKPMFDIRLDEDGKGNWLSPEVEALMAGKGDAAKKPGSGASQNVAFDNVKIEGGRFRFYDAAKKQEVLVEDINVGISAGSLKGPFDSKGSLKYGGQDVAFDVKAGTLDDIAKSIPLQFEASYGAYGVVLKGVAGIAAPYDIQGETTLHLKAEALPIAEDVKIHGILSANQKSVAMKDATVVIGAAEYKGQALIDISPLVVKAAFQGDDVIDVREFIPASSGSSKKDAKDPVLMLTEILPPTLTLPQGFEADVSLKTGGLLYDGALLKGVDLQLSKAGKTFKVSVKAKDMPGNGPLAADATLTYGDVSQSKTGAFVYSDPSLSYVVQANTQNTADAVKALTGQGNLPLLSTSKIGKFYIKGSAKPGRFALSDSVVNLDDLKLLIGGSVTQGAARPLVSAQITANSLNFDQFTGGKDKAASTSSDPTAALKALALPYDADFDISVNEASMNGQAISGLKVGGALRPDTLTIKTLSATNFGGAAFDVSGKIGSLKALDGLDLRVKGSAENPYAVAKTFSVDTASWPKNMGVVSVDSTLKGSVNQMHTNTTVNAFDGHFSLSGNAVNPLTALSLSDLAVRVKHSNLKSLLEKVGVSAPNYASMSQPIDLSAQLKMDDKIITLSGIDAKMLGTTMNGSLRYDGSAAKPDVSGVLKFGNLEMKSVKGVGGSSAGGNATSSSGGKWSNAPMNNAWLHAVNANFDISGDRLLYETWDVTSPALKAVMQNGSLELKDLKGGMFGGQIAMNSKLSAESANAPLFASVDANIQKVNIGKLATALSGSKRLKGDGTVSLTVDVVGNGASQRALIDNLNGAAKLDGQNVVLQGFDLAGLASALLESNKPLPRIQQLVGASSTTGSTAFDTIVGDYAIQSGVVNITTMEMDGPEASIVSTGSADLPKWYINTTHKITLKNAPSVASFDVAIKGPLDNPANTFGKGLFDTYLNEKLGAKIGDFLGDDVSSKLQKFGILPQAKTVQPTAPANDTEPAAGDGTAQPIQQQAQPKSNEEQAQEAIQGVLKGLFQ